MRISYWSSDVCASGLCVFPILGLKAMKLARAGGDERAVRREAWAYSLGIILTCLALGGLLLGLRAAGAAVGWAFQLQDPRIILLLLLLVTRSEEHTSELQSLMRISYAVFCLKKKKHKRA